MPLNAAQWQAMTDWCTTQARAAMEEEAAQLDAARWRAYLDTHGFVPLNPEGYTHGKFYVMHVTGRAWSHTNVSVETPHPGQLLRDVEAVAAFLKVHPTQVLNDALRGK